MSNYYTVFWTSATDGYFQFYRKFRKKMGLTMIDPFTEVALTASPAASVDTAMLSEEFNYFSLPNLCCLSNRPPEQYITSYGCICRSSGSPNNDVNTDHTDRTNRLDRSERSEAKYLIVKRPYSIDYVGFIGGSYAPHQLYFFVQNLPANERQKIAKASDDDDFDGLWYEIFPREKHKEKYYQYAKKKFALIQPWISWIFEAIPSRDPDGIYNWVFPKGKITYINDMQEGEIACAIREFIEETHGIFPLSQEYLTAHQPVLERHFASDRKGYQTLYFIFETPEFSLSDFHAPSDHLPDCHETSDIAWIPYNERDFHLCEAKSQLLQHVERQFTT